MKKDRLNSMQIAICEAPGGNGFCIEHMPDFLLTDVFDNSEPHIHYFYEILWFRQGTGRHVIDFQEYDIIPNTIIFLSPGQIHNFDKSNDYEGISIKMNTEFMRCCDGVNNLFLKYNAFHAFDATPCFHINADTSSTLCNIVSEMEKEMGRKDQFGNIDVLKSLLSLFLVSVLRGGIQDNHIHLDTLKPSHQLFIRFRRLVEKEYMNKHTVQEYAEELNVAVRTLNKCVNECSDMSPLTFINERIILEAKRMVRYTNLLIKEIAYELGYEDPSYFVKFFKRQTGYLPNEFRESESVIKQNSSR